MGGLDCGYREPERCAVSSSGSSSAARPIMTCDLFVSYAHLDDSQGRVDELVQEIASQFRTLAGRELAIFFDKSAIPSMSAWEARIRGALSDARLFLAVVSPSYLASQYCRHEWKEYVRFEAMRHCLGEGVAPVYLVDVEGIESGNVTPGIRDWVDEMRRRQWCDLRPWFAVGRHALENGQVGQRIRKLCEQLHERLGRANRAKTSPSNLYRHNPKFVGRIRELTMLREVLSQPGRCGVIGTSNPGTQRTASTAVHGVGGLGKTEVALAYAHAFAWDYPGGRWLARCEGATDFDMVLAQLCEPMGLALTDVESRDPHRAAERVLARLREQGRSLLLLDNVTHAELLSPDSLMRLPEPEKIHVVATTRLGPAQIGGSPHDHGFVAVDKLPLDDSIALIRSHQPDSRFPDPGSWASARDLAVLLDGFTLAVETAAIYLGRHPGPAAIEDYLARLRQAVLPASEVSAADETVAIRHREKLLSSTIGMTLDALDVVALDILLLAALMPADHVVMPWINQLISESKPEMIDRPIPNDRNDWRTSVAALLSLRLLQGTDIVDQAGRVSITRIHRLIQAVVLNRANHEDVETCRNRLVELAQVKAMRMRTEWLEVSTRWQIPPLVAFAAARLADGDVASGVRLVEQLHDSLWQLGQLRECRDLLERAWEASADDPYGIFELSGAMSRVYRSLGEHDRAIEAMERGLALADELEGDQRRGRAAALNNLGRLELDRGNREKARELLQSALELASTLPISSSEDQAWRRGLLARVMFNLATLELEPREMNLARRWLDRRAELSPLEASDGLEVVDELDAQRLLAMIERATGNLDREREILEQAIAQADTVFREPQVMPALLRSDLAEAFLRAGDPLRAMALLNEALKIMEEALGTDHLRVVDILHRLTLVHDKLHDWDRSRKLHQRIIAILEARLGRDHLDVLKHVKVLALLETELGNLEEAQSMLDRVITETLAKGDPRDPVDLFETFRAKGAVDSQLQTFATYAQTLRLGSDFIVSAFGPADRRLDDFAFKLFQVGVYLIKSNDRELGRTHAETGISYLAGAGAPHHILTMCQDQLRRALDLNDEYLNDK